MSTHKFNGDNDNSNENEGKGEGGEGGEGMEFPFMSQQTFNTLHSVFDAYAFGDKLSEVIATAAKRGISPAFTTLFLTQMFAKMMATTLLTIDSLVQGKLTQENVAQLKDIHNQMLQLYLDKKIEDMRE